MADPIRYFLLSPGDVIQEGDESFSPHDKWRPSIHLSGVVVGEDHRPFRRRADPAPSLGAVAMREAAMSDAVIAKIWAYYGDFGTSKRAIAALPLPSHTNLLAEALRLPEVVALIKAADRVAALAYERDGGTHDADCKWQRHQVDNRCNCGHIEFSTALAAYRAALKGVGHE